MKNKRVAVIFGGVSSEHEVSRRSVETILKNFPYDKYEPIIIGITKKGKWILFSGDINLIKNGDWESDKGNKDAFISPDRQNKGIFVLEDGKYKIIEIDTVFPVLHGQNGEDGTIQGLFELADIPYVGCRCSASVFCMDKVVTNIILNYNGINKTVFEWFYYDKFKLDPYKYIDIIDDKFKSLYPLFVKPSNSGSSVGITKVYNKEELLPAIEVAGKEDNKILIEKGIVGKEVECSVLGNRSAICSVAGEIVPGNDFYDYNDKYINDDYRVHIPARLDESIQDEVRKTALRAYDVMGCSGLSRVDFLVEDGTNTIYLNEINTLPGFTSISMYPTLLGESGIEIKELISKLIELSFERN